MFSIASILQSSGNGIPVATAALSVNCIERWGPTCLSKNGATLISLELRSSLDELDDQPNSKREVGRVCSYAGTSTTGPATINRGKDGGSVNPKILLSLPTNGCRIGSMIAFISPSVYAFLWCFFGAK